MCRRVYVARVTIEVEFHILMRLPLFKAQQHQSLFRLAHLRINGVIEVGLRSSTKKEEYIAMNDDARDLHSGAPLTNVAGTEDIGRSQLLQRMSSPHDQKNELDLFENDLDINVRAWQHAEPALACESTQRVAEVESGQQKENFGAGGQSQVSSLGSIARQLNDDFTLRATDSQRSLRPARGMRGCKGTMVKCASAHQDKEHRQLKILEGDVANNKTLRNDYKNATRGRLSDADGAYLSKGFVQVHTPVGGGTVSEANRVAPRSQSTKRGRLSDADGANSSKGFVQVHTPAGGTESEANRDTPRSIAAVDRGICHAPEPCHGVCTGAIFGHALEDSLAVAVPVVGDEDEIIPASQV